MVKNQMTIGKFLKFAFTRIKLIIPISFLLSFAIIGMNIVQMVQYSNLISMLKTPYPIGYNYEYFSQIMLSTLMPVYIHETIIDVLFFLIMLIFGYWISNKLLSTYMENNRKIFYQLIYLGGDFSSSNSKISKQIKRILVTAVGISTLLIIMTYLLIIGIIGYFYSSANFQTGKIFSLNNLYFDTSHIFFELMMNPIYSPLILFVFVIIIYFFVIKKVIRTNIRYLVIKSEINSLTLSEGADRINSNMVETKKYYFSWIFPFICTVIVIGATIFLFWCINFRAKLGSSVTVFSVFYPFFLWCLYILIIIHLANLLWYGIYRGENFLRKLIYRTIFKVKKFEIKLLLRIKSFSITKLKIIFVIFNLVVVPFGILTQFNSIQQTTANIEKNINLNSYVFEFADNSLNRSNANYIDYMTEINNTLANFQDQNSNIPFSWTFCYDFSVILPNGSSGNLYQIPYENSYDNFVHQQLGANIILQPDSFIINSKYINSLNLNSNTIILGNLSGNRFNLTFTKEANQFPGIFENIGSSKTAIKDVVGVLGSDPQVSKEFSIVNLLLFISKNGDGAAGSDFNDNVSKIMSLLPHNDSWSLTVRNFNFSDPMALTFIEPLQMYTFTSETFVIFGISFVYMFSFTRNYTLPDKKLLHKFGVEKSTLNYSTYHLFIIWMILIAGILLIVNTVSLGFNHLILG